MTDQAGTSRVTPPLAVVGLACRFPDADDPAALLDVVLTGRRSFRRLPPRRIDLTEYYQPDLATTDATYSTRAALLEGWQFECTAFGIDKSSFAAADPAHWLALETAARALSAAGLPAGTGLNRDRTGVIIGNTLAGDTSRANALRVRWPYVRRVLADALSGAEMPASQAGPVLRQAESGYLGAFPPMGALSLAGSMPGTIATTISSYFGFRGGSHAVDSACSSALQAVASACTALVTGDLDAAIAGGVDLSLDPLELIGLAKAGLLATGDVRVYDEHPTGYLPGEGCGVVVLMRAADARAAGLPIYAEILGWGVSSGAKPGQTDSYASSQLLAIKRAYDRSAVDPADIHFIEGNGGSSQLADEAELSALNSIRAGAKNPVALGSIKANIGHAKAAAGAAGLIKAVLALSTGVVPPTTGAQSPHQLITEGDGNLVLPRAAQDWEPGIRLAAVSATGIGGNNVHVVLRHEPAARTKADRRQKSLPPLAKATNGDSTASARPHLTGAPTATPFLLHAPSRQELEVLLSRVAEIGDWLSDAEMQDLACTLCRDMGTQGQVRVAIVAARQEQLAMLAREAATMLPYLADGLMTVRPGIYASDNADGRVTLLLSADRAGAAQQEPAPAALSPAVTRSLATLRWLDSLEVHANAAVGHGVGALAGLAWAGTLGESEVLEIAHLRAQYLRRSAAQEPAGTHPGAESSVPANADATGLSAAIAQRFRFGPPRRRLISTLTGDEIESVTDAIDLICSGFTGAGHVAEAIKTGATGATLLLETGPGHALVNAAAEVTSAPAISLKSGLADPASIARAAGALFAAGALGEPKPLFAGRPARPLDIWREHVFITSPCAPVPRQRLAPDPVVDSPALGGTAARDAADGDTLTPCRFAGDESRITGAEHKETSRVSTPSVAADSAVADDALAAAAESAAADKAPAASTTAASATAANTTANGAAADHSPAASATADGAQADQSPAASATADGAAADHSPAASATANGAGAGERAAVDNALADSATASDAHAPADSAPADSAPADSAPRGSANSQSSATEGAVADGSVANETLDGSATTDDALDSSPALTPLRLGEDESRITDADPDQTVRVRTPSVPADGSSADSAANEAPDEGAHGSVEDAPNASDPEPGSATAAEVSGPADLGHGKAGALPVSTAADEGISGLRGEFERRLPAHPLIAAAAGQSEAPEQNASETEAPREPGPEKAAAAEPAATEPAATEQAAPEQAAPETARRIPGPREPAAAKPAAAEPALHMPGLDEPAAAEQAAPETARHVPGARQPAAAKPAAAEPAAAEPALHMPGPDEPAAAEEAAPETASSVPGPREPAGAEAASATPAAAKPAAKPAAAKPALRAPGSQEPAAAEQAAPETAASGQGAAERAVAKQRAAEQDAAKQRAAEPVGWPGAAATPGATARRGTRQIPPAARRDVAGDDIAVPSSRGITPGAGLGSWTRCFAAGLRPVRRPSTQTVPRPWRTYAAARSPILTNLSGSFAADPAAGRTLAVVEDPSDERSCAIAIEAAKDAVRTGELVVLTTSGGFTGFFASLQAEHPSIGISLLRVQGDAVSPDMVTQFATAEPGVFRELVLGPADAVSEPVLTEADLPGGGDVVLGSEDVIMITRATKGAGLALAQVVACCGGGVAVIGRAGEHDDSELIAGFEDLRSAGARVGYEIIDLDDPAGVSAAIERIEDRLGPVTAIAHAAGLEDPVAVHEIAEAEATAHVRDEAAVLDLLAGSVRARQLKLIISVGTVASRYGLAGASLHALSSAALASQAAELAAGGVGCQVLHLDLPTWSVPGLGERPELAEELAAADTDALDLGVASRLLLKVVSTARVPRNLAIHGRVGGLPAAPAPVITHAEMAAAGLADGAAFLREVNVNYPGAELICSAGLSLASDPYLTDYRIDGMPVLPPVLALEALAQAASVLAGQPFRRLAKVTLESPVLIPTSREAALRVYALRDGDTIVAALRCADSSYLVDHARAEFSCAAEPDEVPRAAAAADPFASEELSGGPSGLVDGAELYGPICFQSGRFRRIALLPEVTARSSRALVRGGDEQPWFSVDSPFAKASFLLGSPGLNDAALQVLQACAPHRRVRPASCESVLLTDPSSVGPVEFRATAGPAPALPGDALVPTQAAAPAREMGRDRMTTADTATLEAADLRPTARWSRRGRRRHQPGEDAGPAAGGMTAAPAESAQVAAGQQVHVPVAQLWNVEAVDADGKLLAAWRGIRLRDSGPLPRNAAWPPALLSVFLERRAADLGLDDGLRVTVSCGHPDGPLPQLLTTVPQPMAPADGLRPAEGRHAGPERRTVHTVTAAGSGALAGFSLMVRAPVPVACGWVAVELAHRRHEPAAGMAVAYAQLRAELAELPSTLAARLSAAGAALEMAGLAANRAVGQQLTVTRTTNDGWVVLALDRALIACAVVELSGVSAPVAVAILTRQHAHVRSAARDGVRLAVR
jgi:acyl transferase domain-containing protein